MAPGLRARELKAAGMDWTAVLAAEDENKRARIAAEILESDDYASTAARVAAFVQQGGGCRATFFNYRRLLQSGPPAKRDSYSLFHKSHAAMFFCGPRIAEGGLVLLAGKTSEHQLDHADLYLRLARGRRPLVLSAVDPATTQPGERPLHHPTPLDHPEAFAPRRPALHLDHVPAVLGDPPFQLMVVVLVVRPELLQAGERLFGSASRAPAGPRSRRPPRRPVTVTARSRPSVSTTMCRFRPLSRLPPSYPCGPPISVALTVWLSMLPAWGLAPAPPPGGPRARKASWIACQVPLAVHRRK